MSQQTLETPDPPVSMLTGHTTRQQTSLTVECQDRSFRRATASLDGGVGGAATAPVETLFDVQGAVWGTSWSLRRKVYGGSLGNGNVDAEKNKGASHHLFDLRHHSMDPKNGWVVEAAGDGRVLATLVHNNFATKKHSDINATVRTTAGEDVLVTMRQPDDDVNLVHLRVGASGELFATIEKTETNRSSATLIGTMVLLRTDEIKPRSVWKVKTAAGVDLSLVMAMVLVRAEMAHVWEK